jgi:hypothetical protein
MGREILFLGLQSTQTATKELGQIATRHAPFKRRVTSANMQKPESQLLRLHSVQSGI